MSTAEEFKAAGNKALQAGDYDAAIDAYTKAIELDPSQHVYFSNRSAAYLSKKDADSALADAEQCIKLNPSWAKGYSRKGAALHALKQYKEAEEVYEEGLKIAPGDAALTSGLEDVKRVQEPSPFGNPFGGGANPFGSLFGPQALLKLAGHPKYSQYLSDQDFMNKWRLLTTSPNAIQGLLQDQKIMEVFSFLLSGEDKGSGMDDSESSMNEDLPTPPAKPAAKEEKSAKEEKEEELSDADKEARKRKADALEAKERGNKHYVKKEFDLALAAYEEAISIDPSNMTFLTNKAAVFFEQGEYDRAITQCQEAIELGRSHRADYADVAKAFVRIGKAQLKKDDAEAALKSFRQAQVENFSKDVEKLIKQTELEKKKRDELAYIDPEKGLEAKERGNEHFRAGSFVEAIKEYQDAVKRDPKNPAYRNNLAAALQKVGDFPAAKAACEKALELDPTYVKAWAKKGDIEFFMKEFHRAMDSYKKGLELEPNNSLCMQGLQKTAQRIREQSTGEVDKERAAHALADPEIQAILSDPVMRQVLTDLNENPTAGRRALQDPTVAAKIEKLIAAGVLRTG